MMQTRTTLASLALLALAGCANDAAAPAATGVSAVRPAAPAPPVTAFDGRYAVSFTLNPDRSKTCPPGPGDQRELLVTNGQATLTINAQNGQVLRGRVGEAGEARMADRLDRSIATTGQFIGDRFTGEHRNGVCGYAVAGRKQG